MQDNGVRIYDVVLSENYNFSQIILKLREFMSHTELVDIYLNT